MNSSESANCYPVAVLWKRMDQIMTLLILLLISNIKFKIIILKGLFTPFYSIIEKISFIASFDSGR